MLLPLSDSDKPLNVEDSVKTIFGQQCYVYFTLLQVNTMTQTVNMNAESWLAMQCGLVTEISRLTSHTLFLPTQENFLVGLPNYCAVAWFFFWFLP